MNIPDNILKLINSPFDGDIEIGIRLLEKTYSGRDIGTEFIQNSKIPVTAWVYFLQRPLKKLKS